ncbi:adenine deaminase C-terminal domain-containing protein [Algiphilus sp.]|uniref:adenine deaminase C-terminal domain-containing protein n=1 Tax=Algiphilus sp. TaxID=1872431 RepID=UPI0025C411EF|nr:adenine deaminase C-terminal domain-containing protein [Algiphilus sp.]MCK5768761.1 adenine deaminase [Algiphilus sp.]
MTTKAGGAGRRGYASVAIGGGLLAVALASPPAGAAAPGTVTLYDKPEPFTFDAETQARQKLVLVALEKAPADLVISGATVLNVHTLQWMENHDIVIAEGRIAWVGPGGEWGGKAAKTVDAEGQWAVPGFGESHKHIESSHLTPEYEAAMVLPQGTTWIAEGSHEFSNVSGEHNVDFWLMARDAGSPLKIYPALGSATPPTAYEVGGGYYGYDEVAALIASDRRVAGLGEVMDWPAIWNVDNPGYQRQWETMQATRDARAVIEGHGGGLVELGEINAMAAAGLSSDHEVRLPQEAWDKMQRGIFLQLKYDGIQAGVTYFLEKGLKDWSNISVTTDDRDALASLKLGTMDYNVKLALRAGAPLEAAYAMASYYPARHWHLEDQVGSLAPGRHADVVLLSDPEAVAITDVYANGKLVGDDGEYVGPIPEIEYPEWATDTMNVGREVVADDFAIRVPAGTERATVALRQPYTFEDPFLTAEVAVDADGSVLRDDAQSISKVGLTDRYQGTGAVSAMFWRNIGPKTPDSAASCSVSHDLHNIWSVGSSDHAMAMATNKVVAMDGGCALVRDHEIVASVRYEIGGLMTQRPAAEVAADIEAMFNEADRMEWHGETPGWPRRMIAAFLTASPRKWVLVSPYAGNPDGFVNLVTGEVHPVAWPAE